MVLRAVVLLLVMITGVSTLSMSALAGRKRVVIFGATGYIGKYVVKESVRRGFDSKCHHTMLLPNSSHASYSLLYVAAVAVVREGSKVREDYLSGAEIVVSDVTSEENILSTALSKPADVVISCLASRSGVRKDAFAIDYQATLNCLSAARAKRASQFILLSAFCVKKPLLQFQKAKLQFEDKLVNAGDIKYR